VRSSFPRKSVQQRPSSASSSAPSVRRARSRRVSMDEPHLRQAGRPRQGGSARAVEHARRLAKVDRVTFLERTQRFLHVPRSQKECCPSPRKLEQAERRAPRQGGPATRYALRRFDPRLALLSARRYDRALSPLAPSRCTSARGYGQTQSSREQCRETQSSSRLVLLRRRRPPSLAFPFVLPDG